VVWLVIGVGAALGGIARHAINQAVHGRVPGATFPAGIFLVNVVGSAAIGVLAGLLAANRLEMSPNARAFVFVGILGGFTTFSSFSLDTLALARDGHLGQALANAGGQVGLSLLAVWIGYRVGLGS
jgi:CrcB protein